MKLLLMFYTIPFMFLNKCSLGNDILESKLHYEISTRGTYKKISIENQKMYLAKSTENIGEEVTVSSEDWKEIITLFEAVNLEKIKGITSETSKRASDRVYHARFKVENKGKKYETNEFDHGNPPKEIEKLINKISKYLNDNTTNTRGN